MGSSSSQSSATIVLTSLTATEIAGRVEVDLEDGEHGFDFRAPLRKPMMSAKSCCPK